MHFHLRLSFEVRHQKLNTAYIQTISLRLVHLSGIIDVVIELKLNKRASTSAFLPFDQDQTHALW